MRLQRTIQAWAADAARCHDAQSLGPHAWHIFEPWDSRFRGFEANEFGPAGAEALGYRASADSGVVFHWEGGGGGGGVLESDGYNSELMREGLRIS